MIRLTLIITILFFTIVPAQVSGPKINVLTKSHNFGNIAEGVTVSHNFVISNNGDDLLKILDIKAGCGCTVAKLDKNELKPGESTRIKVDFNSTGRIGNQKKEVVIVSNDNTNPNLTLTIISFVEEKAEYTTASTDIPRIYFYNNQHDFGNLKEGQKVEFTFKFRNSGKKNLEIKDIKTSCGCTAALVSNKMLKPGEEGTLKVELDTTNREGKVRREVTVISNDPEEPNKILTIFATVSK